MNFEADNLLDHVDEWKFKLHEKLKSMTPEEQRAFWDQALAKARAEGLPIAGEEAPAKSPRKRARRATG